MEAIVLAGGLGTRLRSVVPNLPKPMAEVAGQPFLQILLDSLVSKGFSRVVIASGYKADVISKYFGSFYQGLELIYSEEKTPLGTGGAIYKALEFVTGSSCFILNGDTFFDFDPRAAQTLCEGHPRLAMYSCLVENAGRFGALKLGGPQGAVKAFEEKSKDGPGLINAGIYFSTVEFLRAIEIVSPFSFEEEILPALAQSGQLMVAVGEGEFIDIGIPEELMRAQAIFGQQKN